MISHENCIRRIETAIRADPGGRGLLDTARDPLGLGELAHAAVSLANSGHHAVIVTGFYIPAAKPSATETDGPAGAVALAAVLELLGIATSFITDDYCADAVRAALAGAGIELKKLHVISAPDGFPDAIAKLPAAPSHLIAIERLGRTYDMETIQERWGAETARHFAEYVPRKHWSKFLNMRGVSIDTWTLDFSNLFENPPAGAVTIGIGDGGNEIGMGKFSWHDLARRLPETSPPGILTRVACDHTIIAGTSNWGAIGLAAAVALARQSPEAFASITPKSQQTILDAMVQHGPAVDGVTRRFEATVDGLDSETYLQPIRDIRHLLGIG